jgi:Fic family protein
MDISTELRFMIDRINQLKDEIDALRPISIEVEQRIMQKFRLDWNYHSNAIEGNKLTYGETKTFLLYGLTAKGKPFKDHLDIKGIMMPCCG